MIKHLKNLPSSNEIPEDAIHSKIYLLRGRKVMLDSDLAILYEISTGALIQAVKRNIERFPDDFMQIMTKQEFRSLISQNVISKTGRGGRRTPPFVFTEQGVAMLSSILKSNRAIQVNIQIMRVFSKLRHMLEEHKDLKKKIEEMERRYDGKFKIVFDALRELLSPPASHQKPKGPIGFQP